jgi:hypothetical protein
LIESKVIAAYGRNVVGLGGVREAVVFGEEDALFREVYDVGILVYLCEILGIFLADDKE